MPPRGTCPLESRFWILDVPFPDWNKDYMGTGNINGVGPRARFRAAQDEYYMKTHADDDPATIDDTKRSTIWNNVWKHRDRVEDRWLELKRQDESKRMERELELEKKKSKRVRVGDDALELHHLPALSEALMQHVPTKVRELQCAQVKRLAPAAFARPASVSCTWPLVLPLAAATATAEWFSTVQSARTAKNHLVHITGATQDIWLGGYGGWPGALTAVNHNQKVVTLVVNHGRELDAALEAIPGLKDIVEHVQKCAREITRMPWLTVVRMHFLDQDNTVLGKTAAQQAGFSYHDDKDEEKAPQVEAAAHELTGGRSTSVLFTVVARLGGKEGAFTVVGYKEAQLAEAGNAHMFPSLLQHYTSCLGGHKVAFFLGFAFPLVGEERMSRYQV